MNPRWRRFLLFLTLIACIMVHAPRLHRMHAKTVASPISSPPVDPVAEMRPIATPVVTLELQPWIFAAAPAVQSEPQDLSFYLAKQQIDPPTQMQLDAMSRDLSYFSETEFAPAQVPQVIARSITPIVHAIADQSPDFQPRRERRSAIATSYVRPVIATSLEYDLANHPLNVRVPSTNRPVVRHPTTDDGDGSTAVGGNPEPIPTPTPVPVGGDPGNGGDGSGFGDGVGGLPPPTGGAIPEPSILLPLICIATLLRRPSLHSLK